MTFKKPLFYSLVASFFACFLIWHYWEGAASLFVKAYKAGQPFLVGAGMAYLVNIIMSAYENLWQKLFGGRWQKLNRLISMGLSYLSVFFFVFLIFSIVLPDLIKSLQTLLTIDFGQLQTNFSLLYEQDWFQKILEMTGLELDIVQRLTSYSQQILSQLLTFLTRLLNSASSIAGAIFSVFISLIFSIYVLSSKESLARQRNLLIDTYLGRVADKIYYALGIFDQRFRGFFISQTIEAIILALLCMTGMLLLNFPYATTIGIFVGFTNFVPVVGAYIGGIIGVILMLTQSPTQAIAFLVYLIILQQLESNLIYPRVVGGSIGLPGIWVLVSVTVGGSLFGILGMLTAVPLAASLYQIFKDYTYQRRNLSK